MQPGNQEIGHVQPHQAEIPKIEWKTEFSKNFNQGTIESHKLDRLTDRLKKGEFTGKLKNKLYFKIKLKIDSQADLFYAIAGFFSDESGEKGSAKIILCGFWNDDERKKYKTGIDGRKLLKVKKNSSYQFIETGRIVSPSVSIFRIDNQKENFKIGTTHLFQLTVYKIIKDNPNEILWFLENDLTNLNRPKDLLIKFVKILQKGAEGKGFTEVNQMFFDKLHPFNYFGNERQVEFKFEKSFIEFFQINKGIAWDIFYWIFDIFSGTFQSKGQNLTVERDFLVFNREFKEKLLFLALAVSEKLEFKKSLSREWKYLFLITQNEKDISKLKSSKVIHNFFTEDNFTDISKLVFMEDQLMYQNPSVLRNDWPTSKMICFRKKLGDIDEITITYELTCDSVLRKKQKINIVNEFYKGYVVPGFILQKAFIKNKEIELERFHDYKGLILIHFEGIENYLLDYLNYCLNKKKTKYIEHFFLLFKDLVPKNTSIIIEEIISKIKKNQITQRGSINIIALIKYIDINLLLETNLKLIMEKIMNHYQMILQFKSEYIIEGLAKLSYCLVVKEIESCSKYINKYLASLDSSSKKIFFNHISCFIIKEKKPCIMKIDSFIEKFDIENNEKSFHLIDTILTLTKDPKIIIEYSKKFEINLRKNISEVLTNHFCNILEKLNFIDIFQVLIQISQTDSALKYFEIEKLTSTMTKILKRAEENLGGESFINEYIDPLFFSQNTQQIITRNRKLNFFQSLLNKNSIKFLEFIRFCINFEFNHYQRKTFIKLFEIGLVKATSVLKNGDIINEVDEILNLLVSKPFFKNICLKTFKILLPTINFRNLLIFAERKKNVEEIKLTYKEFIENYIKTEISTNSITDLLKFVSGLNHDLGRFVENLLVNRGDLKSNEQLLEELTVTGSFNEFHHFILMNHQRYSDLNVLVKILDAIKQIDSKLKENSIKIRSLKLLQTKNLEENINKYFQIFTICSKDDFKLSGSLSEKLKIVQDKYEKLDELNNLYDEINQISEINSLDGFFDSLKYFKNYYFSIPDQSFETFIKHPFEVTYNKMKMIKKMLNSPEISSDIFTGINHDLSPKFFNNFLRKSQSMYEDLETSYNFLSSQNNDSNAHQVYKHSEFTSRKLDTLEIIFQKKIPEEIKNLIKNYKNFLLYIPSCLKIQQWVNALNPTNFSSESLKKFTEIQERIESINVLEFNRDFHQYFPLDTSKIKENFIFFEFLETLSKSAEMIEYLKRDIFNNKGIFDEIKMFLRSNFTPKLQLFNVFCIQEMKNNLVQKIIKNSSESSDFFEGLRQEFFSNVEECKRMIFYMKQTENNLKDFIDIQMQVSKNEVFKTRLINSIIQQARLEIFIENQVYVLKIHCENKPHDIKELNDLKSKAIFESSYKKTKDQEILKESYKVFIKSVENIIKVESDLNSLLTIGVNFLEGNKKEFNFQSGDFSELENFTNEVNEVLNKCEIYLIQGISKFHDLTYINGRFYKFIDNYLVNKSHESKIIHLLKFMRKFSRDDESLENEMKRLDFFEYELSDLGSEIIDIQNSHENHAEKLRKKLEVYSKFFGKFEREKGSEGFSNDDKSLIYNCLHRYIFDILITFYSKYSNGNLPKPHQFIHCCKETTWHDLELFLYRISTTESHEIFTFIELEKLSFSNQLNFIELFKTIFSKNSSHIKIFFLSRYEESYPENVLKMTLGIKFRYFEDKEILDHDIIFNKINKLRNTKVFCSDKAGMGKTTSIIKRGKDGKYQRKEILIADIFSVKYVKSFVDESLFNQPIHIHLNLNTVKNIDYLNQFLYNLTVFGYFEENKSFLHKNTIISIEVESTYEHSFEKSLNILKYLQTERFIFNPVNFKENDCKEVKDVGEMMKKIDFENSFDNRLQYIQFFIKENKFENYRQIHLFFQMVSSTLNSFKDTEYYDAQNYKTLINELTSSSEYIATIFRSSQVNLMRAIIKSILNIYSKDPSILINQESSKEPINTPAKSWNTEHRLLIFFDNNKKINIISSNPEKCDDYLKKLMACYKEFEVYKEKLNESYFSFSGFKKMFSSSFNYREVLRVFDSDELNNFVNPNLDYHECLINMAGTSSLKLSEIPNNLKYYKLTLENFMKMIIIHLKLKAQTPIILMGETGCGKTAIINYFVKVIMQEPLKVFTINAGVDLEEIKSIVLKVREEARGQMGKRLWVFLDEFNTSECIHFISQLICENKFNNQELEKNIVWVGACNPYKKIKDLGQSCGLKKSLDGTKLVHMVQKIPHRVIEYVWDFGSITSEILKNYLEKMLDRIFIEVKKVNKKIIEEEKKNNLEDKKNNLEEKKKNQEEKKNNQEEKKNNQDEKKNNLEEKKNNLEEKKNNQEEKKNNLEDNELNEEDKKLKVQTIQAILTAHEYFQSHLGNHSVSLRDVSRFIDLAIWFYYFTGNQFIEKIRLRESIILSIVHCYYLRISENDQRVNFLNQIENAMKIAKGKVMECLKIAQDYFFRELDVGNDIAKNEAFIENIYALIPCVCNQIPIFICGKPGSSKTLSTQFLFKKMKGENSNSELFKKMPEIKEFAFQGSKSCTSEGIKNVFELAIKQAEQYQHDKQNILPVIVFDEIGLAEDSPSNPLKVLHKYLEHEQKTIGFIGLSNWELDASKMNRTLILGRAEPKISDLKKTCLAIASNYSISDDHKALIVKSVEAYSELRNQFEKCYPQHVNFYGHRDFYNIIGKICSDFKQVQDWSNENEGNIIVNAFARNMGGLDDSLSRIKTVLDKMMNIYYLKLDPLELIKENLGFIGKKNEVNEAILKENIEKNLKPSYEPRYLMIIGKKEEIFYLINNKHVSCQNETIKIFGSCFEDDCYSQDSVIDSISDVIRYIEKDVTLIFIDNESIYPALYDLFNQNFTIKDKTRTCKITVGSDCNPNCEVNSRFRCVVVVEDIEENFNDEKAPFLNRFEKQKISVKNLLTSEQKNKVYVLQSWINSFFLTATVKTDFDRKSVFPLLSESLLELFVLMSSEEELEKNFKNLFIRSASNDLPFLLRNSRMDENEKEKILNQWKENHKTCFVDDVKRISEGFNYKMLALTYDSDRVPGFEFSDYFRISDIKTEKEMKKLIEKFRKSEKLILIVDVNNRVEGKHLYHLISVIDSELVEGSIKNYVILVRMQRNDKQRKFIISETSWDVKMYEKMENSPIYILDYLDYSVQSLVLNSNFVNLSSEIGFFIEETVLSIIYPAEVDSSKPSDRKSLIIKSFISEESKNLQEDFIKKVQVLINKRDNLKNESDKIKNKIFQCPDVQKHAINLENSLKILAKNELLETIKLLLIYFEEKYLMTPYIESFSKNDLEFREFFNHLIEKINIEETPKNSIEIIYNLTIPLSREIYTICIDTIKNSSHESRKICKFKIEEKLNKRIEEPFFNIFKSPKNTKLLFYDFVKIILHENSLFYQESSVINSILETIYSEDIIENIILIDKKKSTIVSLFGLYLELTRYKFETIIKKVFEEDMNLRGNVFNKDNINKIWKIKVKQLLETLTLNVFPDDIFSAHKNLRVEDYKKLLQIIFDVSCTIENNENVENDEDSGNNEDSENNEEYELPSIECLLYWKNVSGIINMENFTSISKNPDFDMKKVLQRMCISPRTLDCIKNEEFRVNQEKIISDISSDLIRNQLFLLNAEYLITSDYTLINKVADILNGNPKSFVLENCTNLIKKIIKESNISSILEINDFNPKLIFRSENCNENKIIEILENCLNFSSTFTTLIFDKILNFLKDPQIDSPEYYMSENVQIDQKKLEKRLNFYLEIISKVNILEFPKLNKLVSLAKFRDLLIIYCQNFCDLLPKSNHEIDELIKKKVLSNGSYGNIARNFILKYLKFNSNKIYLKKFIKNTLNDDNLIEELRIYKQFNKKLEECPYETESDSQLESRNVFEIFIGINKLLKDFHQSKLRNFEISTSIEEIIKYLIQQKDFFSEETPKIKFYLNMALVYLVACKKYKKNINDFRIQESKEPLMILKNIQEIIRSRKSFSNNSNLEYYYFKFEENFKGCNLSLIQNTIIHEYLNCIEKCEKLNDIESYLSICTEELLNNIHYSTRNFKYFIFQKYGPGIGTLTEILEEFDNPSEEFQLLRYKKQPELIQIKESPKIKDKNSPYVCVKDIINHDKQLKLLQLLYPMLSFAYHMLDMIEIHSWNITREEAGQKVLDFKSIDNSLFETFIEACETFNKHRPEDAPKLEKMSTRSTLNYFLLDRNLNDKGKFLTDTIKYLIGIYNDFSRQVIIIKSQIMPFFNTSERFYKIQLEIIPKNKAEDSLVENLGECSFNNPHYGLGSEVLFDFNRIELNLSKFLNFDKSLDVNSLRYVMYSDELSKNINDVIQALRNIFHKKERLDPEKKKELREHIKKESKNYEFLNLLQRIMIHIVENRSDGKQTIKKCAKEMGHKGTKLLRIKTKLTMQKIRFIVEIYELVEEVQFENLKNAGNENLEKQRDIRNLLNEIENDEKIEKEENKRFPSKENIRIAWMRMIIRNDNLESGDKLISTLISYESLWDIDVSNVKRTEFINLIENGITFKFALGIYERIINKQEKLIEENEKIRNNAIKKVAKKPNKFR